ncbi:hypothetical protein EIN_226420 [Entamoeba invadens IP1]|uniref:Uncharacterized protein n=1 Tax=Entamoeba invadens IP1 TaxID=370355 RepID=A0A0A1U2L0_ENTIV|nr:hypothetical protein EIN_226420 [Entamoeba invadens IP1]ELP88269.1 hypothetical protein EIN_226420 [Entamoeba invadens IP1]|eukprot:XP_004255040.1 hypothetical protein EIN_226420 [Entamoeba invadens IP1]
MCECVCSSISEDTTTEDLLSQNFQMNDFLEDTSDSSVSIRYAAEGWGNDSSDTELLYNSSPCLPIEDEYPPHPLSLTEEKEDSAEVLKDTEVLLQKLQIMNVRSQKLAKLTGRRNSIEKISSFLVPSTQQEAYDNGKGIVKSDILKQKMGERINAGDIMKITRAKTSQRKMNKIQQILGHPSVSDFSVFLSPKSRKQALNNGKKVKKFEKLQKLAGV